MFDVGTDSINVNAGSGTATFANGGTTTIVPTFTSAPSAGSNYNIVSATALTTAGHTFSVSVPANTRPSFAVVNDGSNHVQLQVTGTSPDGKLVEIIELADHPWFLAVQFHPEFQSKPTKAQPLFAAFIGAAVEHSKQRGSRSAEAVTM